MKDFDKAEKKLVKEKPNLGQRLGHMGRRLMMDVLGGEVEGDPWRMLRIS